MISEREKAFFIQGVMMATSLLDEDDAARVAQLSTHLRKALVADDGALAVRLIVVATELYDALRAGGFDAAAATRREQ